MRQTVFLTCLLLGALVCFASHADPSLIHSPAGVGELSLDAAALRQGLLSPAPEISWNFAGQVVRLSMARDRPLQINEEQIEIPVELLLGDPPRPVRTTSGWRPHFDRIHGRWSLALVQVQILSVSQEWEPGESPLRVPIASRWSFPPLAPVTQRESTPSTESAPPPQRLQAFLQSVRLQQDRVVLEFGFRAARPTSATR